MAKAQSPVLGITDRRMLELAAILKESGRIRYMQEFCDAAYVAKQAIRQIKRGTLHFSGEQIAAACKAFGANANFIVGTSDVPFLGMQTTEKSKDYE